MRKDGIRCRLCVERVATLKVINRAAGSGGGNDTLRQQSRREADSPVALPSSPNALPCPQSLTRHRQGLSSLVVLGFPKPDLARSRSWNGFFATVASSEEKDSVALILEIDIGQLLPGAVDHDEAGVVEFFNRPGRREVAL